MKNITSYLIDYLESCLGVVLESLPVQNIFLQKSMSFENSVHKADCLVPCLLVGTEVLCISLQNYFSLHFVGFSQLSKFAQN